MPFNYYNDPTDRIICFVFICTIVAGWIIALIIMGICLCVNHSKLQPLTYRLIATTPPKTTPMEVIIEQENQVITGTAPLKETETQRKNSDRSLAKTKSATATASAATPKKDNSK